MSRDILLNLIDPDPDQPRKHFDQAKLDELAQSIKANGLAVPILLRPDDDRFIIVHGERRYRAALSLEWQTIAAEVKDIAPQDAHWLALVENVQRDDLSPIEEAKAYQAALGDGLTQAGLGERIGKTQSYIAQKLRLLRLPPPIQFYLNHRAISEGHARQLMRLKNIYTEDVIADLSHWLKLPPSYNGVLDAIRPEDTPIAFFGRLKTDLLESAVKELFAHVKNLGGKLPQWHIAGFWWASVIVAGNVSVIDLNKFLDGWTYRFYCAVHWARIKWDDYIKADPPENSTLALQAWGYTSDLNHSGIGEKIPDKLLKQAITQYNKKYPGKFIPPSNCQPWGPYAHRWRLLIKIGRLRDEMRESSYDRDRVKEIKLEIKELQETMSRDIVETPPE